MSLKFTELLKDVYYYLVWLIFTLFLHTFFKLKIVKLHKDPLPESCIIVANHRSILDTALLFILFKEKLKFISTNEVMNFPFWGRLLKPFEPIIVSRDGFDRKAINISLTFLKNNGKLALFPEGGIRKEPFVSFTTGAAFLAMKANIPVIPVGIQNSYQALMEFSHWNFRSKVKVIVGAPIIAENDYKQLSKTMQYILAQLEEWDDSQPKGIL